MTQVKETLKKHWFWIGVNLAALLPLLWLAWDTYQGNIIDPVDAFTDRTGKAALIILLASLACTPANTILGFRRALKVRKSLGLFAFLYASLHLLVFVGLDYGFSWNQIVADSLLTKRYILVGFAAFLILLPLAFTSTRGWMKRLGRNWKRLHRFVYAIGILVILHYILLVKSNYTEPLIYAAVLTVLLLARVPGIRRRLSRLRSRTSRPSRRTVDASPPATSSMRPVPISTNSAKT